MNWSSVLAFIEAHPELVVKIINFLGDAISKDTTLLSDIVDSADKKKNWKDVLKAHPIPVFQLVSLIISSLSPEDATKILSSLK